MIGWLLSTPFARQALGFALAAITILLFLINLRRAGEKAGRATERIVARERNDAIHKEMLEAASRRPHDRGALTQRLRDGEF